MPAGATLFMQLLFTCIARCCFRSRVLFWCCLTALMFISSRCKCFHSGHLALLVLFRSGMVNLPEQQMAQFHKETHES
ncbi:hypothetical protein GGR57DRAFT_446095 [Xylariaceae sp. FL1272]|nr:hypothetical protein GGR57DRAFT_446095 [Xylariaceae sp. FL1272]